MRIAALDLGSNSFHLLIANAHPDGTFEPLLREKETLRLADVVTRAGRIGEEGAARAVEVVNRFRTLAESVGAEEVVACATSAIREADDSATLVDHIEAETGVRVTVISGKDEARLIFAAVRASVILEPSRLRGFAPEEINILACLGRFHRRGNPKLSFEPFNSVPPARRNRVLKLIALLRIADGLDRSHTQAVESIGVKLEPDRVRLVVQARGDIDLELWGLRRKRELFERVFELPLEVELAS
ncbi:MAG TPA: hypothetical protein VF942_06295 [Acidimicrobiales bacterium]